MTIAIVVAITLCVTASARRSLRRHGAIVAMLAGTLFLPVAMTTLAFAVAWRSAPGEDGPGMLVGIAVMLSIHALPVTFATSLCYLWIARRRR